MLSATSAGFRVLALAASTAVHAAAFVAMGHSPSTPAPPFAASTISEIDAPIVQDVPEPTPAVEPRQPEVPRAAKPHPPTHTHAYPVPADHDAHPHDPSLVHAPIGLPPAPEPAPAAAPAPAPARFSMTITNGDAHGHAHEHGHDHGAEPGHGSGGGASHGDGAPVPESAVAVPARELRKVFPAYPPEARAQAIEADVIVEIVVDASGGVREARVVRRAGYGFDESALAAVRATRFSPARVGGAAVAVRMRYTIEFRLR